MSRQTAFVFLLGLAVGVAASFAGLLSAKQSPQEYVVVQEKPPPEPPDDTKLYVWQPPEKGTQSLLVLRALDNDRLEAAYIVPVVIVVDYGDKGKATKEQLDVAATGKLLPFDLRGKDRFGRVTADAYLGKENGWLSTYASKIKAEPPKDKPAEKDKPKDK